MIQKTDISSIIYRASSLLHFRTMFGAKGSRLGGGGRFNRPGTVALYAALDPATAYLEYQQGKFSPLLPCVIATGDLILKDVIDLTGDLSPCHIDLQNWNCDWGVASAAYARDQKDPLADCPSWRCYDIAIMNHCSGILYNSTKNPVGKNLAIFLEDCTAGNYKLDVHDPFGDIPRAAKGVP